MKIPPVEAELFMRMDGWTAGGTQTVRRTVGQRHRQIFGHTDRESDRQIEIQSERRTDRQT
jgi:hypothetical protein